MLVAPVRPPMWSQKRCIPSKTAVGGRWPFALREPLASSGPFWSTTWGRGGVGKYFYIQPNFRYERPDAGRYRQHHQFGAEIFGAADPEGAEVILLAMEFLSGLGLGDLVVNLNSIGCPVCRPDYREVLRDYYRPQLADLCEDCQNRFERNPLRLLDCKHERCHGVAAGAPRSGNHSGTIG